MSVRLTVRQFGFFATQSGKNVARADWVHQETFSGVNIRFRGHAFVGTRSMPTIDSCFDQGCHSDVDIVNPGGTCFIFHYGS